MTENNVFSADSSPNKTCEAKELGVVCKEIGNDWKRLARALELEEAQMHAAEFIGREDLYEISYQMLLIWRQSLGLTADKAKLSQALTDIGRTDIIHKLFPYEVTKNGSYFPKYVVDQDTVSVIIKEIQNLQKILYQNIELPKVQWLAEKMWPLEELYIDMMMELNHFGKTVPREQHVDGDEKRQDIFVQHKRIKLEAIFDSVLDQTPSRRILVEGKPGYGKTTLVCKLAFDWSRGAPYISSRFDLLFVIALRHFSSCFEDVFIDECRTDKISDDLKLQIISQHQERILTILDGFDEMSESTTCSVIPLLLSEQYPLMTVLVTSRKGYFTYQKEPHSQSVNFLESIHQNPDCLRFWKTRIELCGIQETNQKNFLKRYLCAEDQLKACQVNLKELKDLCRCPLFLILFAVLIEELQIENISTKTHLYKTFLNFIVKRELSRQRILGEEEYSLFEDKRNPVYRHLLNFGKLALENLKNNRLTFEESEVLSSCDKDIQIFKLGFLVKVHTFQRHKKHNFYEIVHKSFLEFLAAFYLSQLDQKTLSSEIRTLMEMEITLESSNLFFIFLANLLGKEVNQLFESLSCWAGFYSWNSPRMRNILNELKYESIVVPNLLSFVPNCWMISTTEKFYKSKWHKAILQMSLDKGLIQTIIWNPLVTCSFPKLVRIETLVLYVTTTFIPQALDQLQVSFKCHDLLYWLNTYHIGAWTSLAEFIPTIKMEKFSMNISGYFDRRPFFNQLQKELTEDHWKTLKLWNLKVFGLCIKADQDLFLILEQLIKNERITHGLWVWIGWQQFLDGLKKKMDCPIDQLESFLTSVAESKTVRELGFINYVNGVYPSLRFNLQSKNNTKSWDSIYLDGNIRLEIDQEIPVIQTAEFGRGQITESVHLLSNCRSVKKLKCSEIVCRELNKMSLPWKGFNSLKELHVTLTSTSDTTTMSLLGQLTNLQNLTLDLFYVNVSPMSEDFVNSVVSALRCLELQSLTLKSLGKINLSSVKSILQKTFCQESIPDQPFDHQRTKATKIGGLALSFNASRNLSEVHELFMICENFLQEGHLKTLSVVHPGVELQTLTRRSFQVRKGFRFRLGFDGNIIEHSTLDSVRIVIIINFIPVTPSQKTAKLQRQLLSIYDYLLKIIRQKPFND